MKKIFFILFAFSTQLTAQHHLWFDMPSFWEVGSIYTEPQVYNIEAYDINKDGNLDVIAGNWNDTWVYYGGYGILDETEDLRYTGRMLAVCDYNGDGYEDIITMHFTGYDSSRYDYDGELLFYMGSYSTSIAIDTIPDYSRSLPTPYPTIERFTMGYYTVGIQKGDLNGDNKTDLVFNSTESADSLGSYPRGKIYIYMGKEIPTDTADFVLTGNNVLACEGDFVQVGNLNDDGYDDLLFSSILPISGGGVTYDSLNYLHIYYGSENFSAIEGNESELYSSYVNPPDSTAGWFLRRFSVDDINGDGIDDIIVGRSFYNYPHISTVHYGSINGIDTIPSFTFIQDTTNLYFFSAGGVTQNVGDFNMDGYDDFIMSPAGYKQFALHFGGPYVSNGNRYGARGYTQANPVFPRKSVNMGNQTIDNENDIAVLGGWHILMLYGQNIPTEVKNDFGSPQEFDLYQNYPNPFNSTTIINYQLTINSFVTFKLYDILGEEITTLINEEQTAGEYTIEFDASRYKLSSGVYLYKLKTKGGELTKKMTYLK